MLHIILHIKYYISPNLSSNNQTTTEIEIFITNLLVKLKFKTNTTAEKTKYDTLYLPRVIISELNYERRKKC